MMEEDSTKGSRRRRRRVAVAEARAEVDSPLLRMVRETPTDYWNDSCSIAELEYAVARGAAGATSNPTIGLEVLRKEAQRWLPRVRQLAVENPAWTEVDLTWALVEEMATGA